jgi:hypothetical protein
MSLFVFFISLLIIAQHVSGNNVPIIRSWRLSDVIASCWYVLWLQGGCQVRLVGSASMDGFVAVFFISLLIVAQHVSGNHVPIIRSWRLRDVIASCWYVLWLQEGGQVRLAGSASMDGFVKRTHPCFPDLFLEETPKHFVLYAEDSLRAKTFTGRKTKSHLLTERDSSSIANCCIKIPAIFCKEYLGYFARF